MSKNNVYGQLYETIDRETLIKVTAIVNEIYPMVMSKIWNVNKMAGALKLVAGTTVDLDENNFYNLDVVGNMRTTGDVLLYGDVSMNKNLYVNKADINNASIDTLFVSYLYTDITDLFIQDSIYVDNNVSINGGLYNFSNTFLNYLNVSNDTTLQNNVDINGSTNLNGLTNLNGISNLNTSTYLNGMVYLNNNLFNQNNKIFCTSQIVPTQHNYIEGKSLIDIDGLGYIDSLITNNISSTIIKSSVFTSLSDSLGCSLTNILNLSVVSSSNISAKVNIGNTNNPVKLDLIAEQENNGIIYKGTVYINKKFNINDQIVNSIDINGINSNLNINGNIQLNTITDFNNKFYLQGGGKIVFDGITYLNNLDIGYNNVTKASTPFDTSYKLNVSGNMNVSGSMRITNNFLVGGSITHYSDLKLKTNLVKLENSLNKINNINGYTYNRIDLNDDKIYMGLIAQEVEKEYPDIIEYTNDIRSINYQSFTAVLLNSIKELNIKVMELENKINK